MTAFCFILRCKITALNLYMRYAHFTKIVLFFTFLLVYLKN